MASWKDLGKWRLEKPTNGVQAFQQEHESEIVCFLISKLGIFNLGLGSEPGFDRMIDRESLPEKPRIHLIGSLHVIREGLADKGYEVTLVYKPDWRALTGTMDEKVEMVNEAMASLTPRDLVVVQWCHNSEVVGYLPIRQYVDGEFHIEGYLILAGKDRQFMTFQNIETIFRILERWRAFVLTPMLWYLREGCCDKLEQAPNQYTPGFEEGLQRCLSEF